MDKYSEITAELFFLIVFRILSKVNEHTCQAFGIERCDEISEIIGYGDVQIFFMFTDIGFNNTSEILIEKSFQNISSERIVGAVYYVRIARYVVVHKRNNLLIVEQKVILLDYFNCLLLKHPLEGGINIFKVVIECVSVYVAFLCQFTDGNF